LTLHSACDVSETVMHLLQPRKISPPQLHIDFTGSSAPQLRHMLSGMDRLFQK